MFFTMLILALIGWILIRPKIPPAHQHLSVGIAVACFCVLPVFFSGIFSTSMAHNFFWPVAAGLALGEATVRGWQKFKVFHYRFTNTSESKKQSKPKSSSRTSDSKDSSSRNSRTDKSRSSSSSSGSKPSDSSSSKPSSSKPSSSTSSSSKQSSSRSSSSNSSSSKSSNSSGSHSSSSSESTDKRKD